MAETAILIPIVLFQPLQLWQMVDFPLPHPVEAAQEEQLRIAMVLRNLPVEMVVREMMMTVAVVVADLLSQVLPVVMVNPILLPRTAVQVVSDLVTVEMVVQIMPAVKTDSITEVAEVEKVIMGPLQELEPPDLLSSPGRVCLKLVLPP
jgi:hypothetical protein